MTGHDAIAHDAIAHDAIGRDGPPLDGRRRPGTCPPRVPSDPTTVFCRGDRRDDCRARGLVRVA